MMGGSHHPEVDQMSEQELIEQALRILPDHLAIARSSSDTGQKSSACYSSI